MNKKLAALGSIIADVAIAIGIFLIVFQLLIGVALVNGSSMETALSDGDIVITDRLTPVVAEPRRFDIVSVQFPSYEEPLIKRVIGMPGERIEYIGNDLYINGAIMQEDFLVPQAITDYFKSDSLFPETNGVIPDGEYLVLGDNRQNSKDGRKLGTVKKTDIIGIARLRVYPLNKITWF